MSTDNKSDNRTSSVREPEPWLGATSNQALFFAMLMKLVFSFYDFKQLIETATVTMKDGTIAVHSPEHWRALRAKPSPDPDPYPYSYPYPYPWPPSSPGDLPSARVPC